MDTIGEKPVNKNPNGEQNRGFWNRWDDYDDWARARKKLVDVAIVWISFLFLVLVALALVPDAEAQAVAGVRVTGPTIAGDSADHVDMRPGQRVALGGVALDSAGNTIAGRSLVWKSGNPDVASITSGGIVTARKRGYATITGSIGAFSATVRACVINGTQGDREPMRVTQGDISIEPAAASLGAPGAKLQLVAVVEMTARDTVNSSAQWGPCVHWYLGDPSLETAPARARIDRAGVLRILQGVSGRVDVGAVLGGPVIR